MSGDCSSLPTRWGRPDILALSAHREMACRIIAFARRISQRQVTRRRRGFNTSAVTTPLQIARLVPDQDQQCPIHSGSGRIVMGQRDDFSESTIEAMMAAQRTSLTAQVGVAEYFYLGSKGIQPKITYSKSFGFRVRAPTQGSRSLSGHASEGRKQVLP